MKFSRIVPISFILLFLHAGCKTSQKIQPVKATESPTISPAIETRISILSPDAWMNNDAALAQKNISAAIEKAAAANSKAVILFMGERAELLTFATEQAHKLNLKIYAGIDFKSYEQADLPTATLKTRLRKTVIQVVNNHNIDGLSFKLSDLYPDIIEDIVVAAMLIKPYLVNSILYSGEKGQQNALSNLEEGIVDFILPYKNENPDSYSEKVKETDIQKKIRPGQVLGLDVSALFPANKSGQTIYINQRQKTKVTDTEGRIGFIISQTDSISIETAAGNFLLKTDDWSLPYNYALQPDGKTIRKGAWVEFRRLPALNTDLPAYDFLSKADYPAQVWINGDPVKQYKTGIFFKRVNFAEGPNRVRATVLTRDSQLVFYEPEFYYEKKDKRRQVFPLWINEPSVSPNAETVLLRDDVQRLSFEGSKGQNGMVVLKPSGIKIPCQREDFEDYSLYRAELPLQKLEPGVPNYCFFSLTGLNENSRTEKHELPSKNALLVQNLSDFPIVRVKERNVRLTYNTGSPRLGGPIRAELGPGVLLKTNGVIGDNYRVRLSGVEDGIINKSDVEVLPAGTVKPSYSISSISCGPGEGADLVSIPYLEPVPYEVAAEPEQNRIVITLFGVETSSTWITHRAGRRLIDKVTWKQTTPETYQVYVNLKTDKIWGYDLVQNGRTLVLRIKYAPAYDLTLDKPLSGLKISIEAGHGGSNTGAVGLSGLLEKDINLDLSLRLGELLKFKGAEVFQVRDSDKDMALLVKRELAVASGADLHLSIHANAGGGGYLRVSGTSTYYHNPFWAPFAEKVYNRLLEMDLAEFGVVGSFNYTVTRMTQMPSILVEQAFLSHAEDEEKMADAEFRQQMAQKIYEGILDYLRGMKE